MLQCLLMGPPVLVKTYTMLGNDRKLGIMGLTLNELFAEMELTKEDVKYKVTMSYLEVISSCIFLRN